MPLRSGDTGMTVENMSFYLFSVMQFSDQFFKIDFAVWAGIAKRLALMTKNFQFAKRKFAVLLCCIRKAN